MTEFIDRLLVLFLNMLYCRLADAIVHGPEKFAKNIARTLLLFSRVAAGLFVPFFYSVTAKHVLVTMSDTAARKVSDTTLGFIRSSDSLSNGSEKES